MKKKNWCVILCQTENGVRVGISELEAAVGIKAIATKLTQDEAMRAAEQFAAKSGIPMYEGETASCPIDYEEGILISKYAWILADAEADFKADMNWVEFSNKYFARSSRYLPDTAAERREYVQSPEYKQIQDWKYELMKRQGAEDEETPDLAGYSGEFRVRIPRSLHKRLTEEAAQEGVSLNQLIVSKLSIPLYTRLMGDGK